MDYEGYTFVFFLSKYKQDCFIKIWYTVYIMLLLLNHMKFFLKCNLKPRLLFLVQAMLPEGFPFHQFKFTFIYLN